MYFIDIIKVIKSPLFLSFNVCHIFQIEGKPGTVGGEGVLQNFFNSLLNRRTGSPIGGPLASVRAPGGKFYLLIFA